MPKAEMLPAEDIRRQIAAQSRDPFIKVLADMVAAAPDLETLRTFAADRPDRWSQAVAMFGRLAGYTERSEHPQTNIYLQITAKSDAELELDHQRLLLRLQDASAAKDSPAPIEAEIVEAE